jgi:hypothetical protein
MFLSLLTFSERTVGESPFYLPWRETWRLRAFV